MKTKHLLYPVPDGLDELRAEMALIVDIIARTSRWVHPDTFHALPVWYPEKARGLPSYNQAYDRILRSKKNRDKVEGNIWAQAALQYALNSTNSKNWTVCHIWGIDDPQFQKRNSIVQDRRFYSCVGNMVWLPTPLKGFTDAVPEIKTMLRTCAFHLYGWACEHDDAETQKLANLIRSGAIPAGYPSSWPTAEKRRHPKNTAPFTPAIANRITRRKREILSKLESDRHEKYPRHEVQEVLDFWGVKLFST